MLTYPLFKPRACSCKKQAGWPATHWLTIWSNPRECSCQKEPGRVSQMLTYTLLKTQSMLLSATSWKGQPDDDLHPVQNPEHALVSNKHAGAVRCWLTFCLKPEHSLVSIKWEVPARSWLTNCSKPKAWYFQQKAEGASYMRTYKLFKIQSMLMSATSRKGQPDADLHPAESPEHALVSNKQEGLARCQHTLCSKHSECPCQQEAPRGSEMLTYSLFNSKSMVLSARSRKGQPDADLHPVENPEHALVSNKQEGAARSWLTPCWKPTAYSRQKQAWRASQMLTNILFKTQSMLLSATSGNN